MTLNMHIWKESYCSPIGERVKSEVPVVVVTLLYCLDKNLKFVCVQDAQQGLVDLSEVD